MRIFTLAIEEISLVAYLAVAAAVEVVLEVPIRFQPLSSSFCDDRTGSPQGLEERQDAV
jgi:hypothetical protein